MAHVCGRQMAAADIGGKVIQSLSESEDSAVLHSCMLFARMHSIATAWGRHVLTCYLWTLIDAISSTALVQAACKCGTCSFCQGRCCCCTYLEGCRASQSEESVHAPYHSGHDRTAAAAAAVVVQDKRAGAAAALNAHRKQLLERLKQQQQAGPAYGTAIAGDDGGVQQLLDSFKQLCTEYM
jgi:hypothetical protein